jgi:hypothetical protein
VYETDLVANIRQGWEYFLDLIILSDYIKMVVTLFERFITSYNILICNSGKGHSLACENYTGVKLFLRIENSSDSKKVRVAIFQKFYNKIKCMELECKVGSQTWSKTLDKETIFPRFENPI